MVQASKRTCSSALALRKASNQSTTIKSAPGRGGRQPELHRPVGAYTTSPEGKAELSMTETIFILKRIEEHLACIERQLGRTPLSEALAKPAYSCRELAQLSQSHGVQSYREFTIRLACNDGRVPEAHKCDNGTWSIPRDAVLRLLENGLPPERRPRRITPLPDNSEPRLR